MSAIKLFFFPNKKYENVILMLNTDDVYYWRHEIYEKIIKERAVPAIVLVDLLFRNGLTSNRYSLINFFGRDEFVATIIPSEDVDLDIKLRIREYLLDNGQLMKNTSMSEKTIRRIMREGNEGGEI